LICYSFYKKLGRIPVVVAVGWMR